MRASCWVIVLAPSTAAPRRRLCSGGAAHRERVDSPVAPEAPVLGRDDRLAQRGGDLRERDVDAAAVEREPGLARLVEKDGAARAGRQAPDRQGVGDDPGAAGERARRERDEQHPACGPRNAPAALAGARGPAMPKRSLPDSIRRPDAPPEPRLPAYDRAGRLRAWFSGLPAEGIPVRERGSDR